MLLYFAGLRNVTVDLIRELQSFILFLTGTRDKIDYSPLCCFVFECQCPHLLSQIFQNGCQSFADFFSNDLEHFVHGYCLAHSHPNCSWHVEIRTDALLQMMLMGMQYTKPAPGMGGTIKYL